MTPIGSKPWTGEPDGLVGRESTLTALQDLLSSGRRAAVVAELPGAGKTAVLRAVGRAAVADGWRVLSLTGHVSDKDTPYGVLVDLLTAMPGAQALLDDVVGRTQQEPLVDPLRLRLDLLTRLQELSAASPVLVVLDDAQWCDDSSLSVLAFISHRLVDTDVSFVAAARGDLPPDLLVGHARVVLPPLDDRQAREVLRRAAIRLDAVSLPTVVQRAAGNPLALLEISRAAATTAGVLPSSVEAAFGGQVEAMPDATRQVLVLAAACDGDLQVLGRVVDTAHLVDDLGPAESAGLVRVEGRRLVFRHPLARTAVYAGATTAERIRAHEALAVAYVGDAERELWHRSEACVLPDEALAARLAELAEHTTRRSAATEAARLMHRASELTPDAGVAEHRLLQATILYGVAGKFDWVVEVARRLRDGAAAPEVRAGAGHMYAYALTQTDDYSRAREAIDEALEPLLAVDPLWGWSTLGTYAVQVYRHAEGSDTLGAWLERFERETDPAESPFPSLIPPCRVWVRTQVDPLRRDEADLEAVRSGSAPDDVPLDVAATHEMMLGAAAYMLDEPAIAVRRLARAVDLMERASAPGEMTQTMMCLGGAWFSSGDYDAALETAQRVVDIAEARSLDYPVVEAVELQARVAAIRGEVARARELCDEVTSRLRVGESTRLDVCVRWAMSRVRLAEGDPIGAWDDARWLFRDDGTPRHPQVSYLELGSYVATAVRAGAQDDARRVVEVAAQTLSAAGRHRLELARARALLSAEDAEPWHVEAVSVPGARQWPFELANAQLEYGAWLRRRHRQTEARAQLVPALETFTRLGTRPWAELARAELRAAGVATEGPERPAWAELTGQEREVVRLAASGRTNPEIAAALYLSPRTVSTHLYNAFPKLGVTSRAQLRDVVPEMT